MANKRDTRSIEQAMNEIRAKKRQKTGDEDTGAGSTSTSWEGVCVWLSVKERKRMRGTEGVPKICINLQEAYYIERSYMFPRTYTVGETCG